MDQFLQMDIFFFVTTIVVIVVGILMVAILISLWRILKYMESISKDVSEESVLLRGDIAELRSKIKTGSSVLALGGFLSKAFKRFSGRSGRRGTSRE